MSITQPESSFINLNYMSMQKKRDKAEELSKLLIGVSTQDAKEICKLFLLVRLDAMSILSPDVVGRH